MLDSMSESATDHLDPTAKAQWASTGLDPDAIAYLYDTGNACDPDQIRALLATGADLIPDSPHKTREVNAYATIHYAHPNLITDDALVLARSGAKYTEVDTLHRNGLLGDLINTTRLTIALYR